MVLTEVDHLTILAAMYLVAVSAAEYLIAILVVVVLADAFVSSSCGVFGGQYRRQKIRQRSIAATEYSASVLVAEFFVVVAANICQQYWRQQLLG